ncbi:MAG: hypothetical protein HOL37_03340 [Rhodospirillaceae bacterium]|jgi:hypothetical protein|nr:hypothetical protein [Rhodospirillaceae bacterium]MBT4220618.1 hypothetical protein [Rhodospirillaceae bacterium]MBT5014587.1 hypothetical protein [Rhodospirillaceae bacterium]MBT5308347.1 hypothetical protein [Rhodospirillaceae bacterium]MBT7356160.1 hypothetical protein [Rhodospirillaceae bacterium]
MLNKINSLFQRVVRDEAGGVAVYTGFFSVLALGAGTLVLDVGRMGVLRSQMQNRADAGAMAGASQLDGRVGAQSRAIALATNAMSQASFITSGTSELTVQSVDFYSEVEPDKIVASGDEDSKFIEIELDPKSIDFMFKPLLVTASGPNTQTMNAHATASSQPFICHAPPLMICDPGELDSSQDLSLQSNIGRQIALKPPPSGGTAWAPGNYGLLALPDGSQGASDIEGALAAVEPADCYGLDVGTAPGVKTTKVKNGVNARFDLPGGLPYPAPNVINFPKDADVAADPNVYMGSGNWDLATYWADRHSTPLPTDLLDASRYQVYLYELGFEYARNGRQTIYPIEEALPSGFVTVTPMATDIPVDASHPDDPDYDGVPTATVADNGYSRRLVQVAVLQCQSEGVKGSHEYPTNGNYLEMFITEAVDGAPAGGIYAEIVRTLTPSNDPDFHANVKLVE